MKRARPSILAATLILASTAPAALAGDTDPEQAMIERGRYIARIAGCNDCHTPDYAMTGGAVPEQQWLTGDRLGWRGPWGTTYPTNLRLSVSRVDEDSWVRNARTASARPPMPWFALRDMDERDLRALYRFVRALGPAGEPAPAYLPPGVQPQGVAIVFPAAPE